MGGEKGVLRFMSQTPRMIAAPQPGLPETRIAVFLEISGSLRSRWRGP